MKSGPEAVVLLALICWLPCIFYLFLRKKQDIVLTKHQILCKVYILLSEFRQLK